MIPNSCSIQELLSTGWTRPPGNITLGRQEKRLFLRA